jgi:hypothetical protein
MIAQGLPLRERFPRTVAVGDLDEAALRDITEAAITGWYSTQFNTLLVPEEAEELLPELAKLPIDWGTPLGQWSRQQVIELVKGISWLLAERGTLDSCFWGPCPLSFPWPAHRPKIGQEHAAEDTAEGVASTNGAAEGTKAR